MSQFFSSLQSQFLFGRPVSAWHVLDDSDLERLSLPGFLQDQVFQVSFVPGAMLHCFEVRVSEQTPRDAYDHIARGLARLGPSAFAANIVHGRSPNAHLIFWRETHGQRFHHLEMDFSRSNKYDREVLAFLRKPIPANFEALFAGLESAANSKAFFKTLQRCLKDVPCNQPSAYYGLVDLLLKVIFLIFVQRKGWLNFDPGYLDNKMRACDRRGLSIVTCFFKPLFARLEGVPGAERLELGNLPRLGGGMFAFQAERLPAIENQWCLNLLQTLMAGYSFSLFEPREDRQVVGISPEVLGHVFENLLLPGERKFQGTYYTPRAVAQNQVREAFDAYFRHNPSSGSQHDQRDHLFSLKILDPSCGSGTYLLAVYTELLTRHLDLAPREERYNGKLYRLKQRIMQENLFGLDINPMATRLTEVRLWLNMIQDLDIGEPASAPGLPSLQHHIRPGDFLGQYLPKTTRCPSGWSKFEHLEKLRLGFPSTSSSNRSAALQHLFRLERELHDYLLEGAAAEERETLREALSQQLLPGLEFGGKLPERTFAVVNTQLHVIFSGVLETKGFDLIVGNPPWLSGSKIPAVQKRGILERLVLPAGLRLRGQPDLSMYFLIAAIRWLKPGGHLSFLVPGKFLQAQYAESIRGWLQRFTRLDYLFDDGIDQRLIFSADTFPLGLGFTSAKPDCTSTVCIRRRGKDVDESFVLPQASLSSRRGVWALTRPDRAGSFLKRRTWPLLDDLPFKIQRGVVTHDKRQFVFKHKPDLLPVNHLRPLLRGRDIQVEKVEPGALIYWPFSDGPRWSERLQKPVAAWLDRCKKVGRKDGLRKLPYAMKKMGPWCLVWKYLASTWHVALLKAGQWIPDQTTYFINVDNFETGFRLYRYFNSLAANEELRLLAERGKDRCLFFYAHTCKQLPVPPDLLTAEIKYPNVPGDLYPPADLFADWMIHHAA